LPVLLNFELIHFSVVDVIYAVGELELELLGSWIELVAEASPSVYEISDG